MENMLRKFFGPVPIWKTFIAVAVWLLFVGLIADFNATEWASWVQAVGSIGAIIGSVALARSEAKSAGEVQRQKNMWLAYHNAQLASSIASDVELAMRSIEMKMGKRQVNGQAIGNERLLQVQRTLDALCQRDVSPVLLIEILTLQREVAYSLTAVRELGRRPVSDERIAAARRRLEKVRCARDRIGDEVGRYARELHVNDNS